MGSFLNLNVFFLLFCQNCVKFVKILFSYCFCLKSHSFIFFISPGKEIEVNVGNAANLLPNIKVEKGYTLGNVEWRHKKSVISANNSPVSGGDPKTPSLKVFHASN